ncbi:MAG TPA: IS4 family transposase [Kamptonema sp.]|nr:IS4 family transposase [Kamptonema sp.]
MLPSSYQICFQQQLKKTEYLTLTILVFLLQVHKQVSIEFLATLMPYPIMFESRRRGIQRFLKLPILKIEKLWFPLIKYILRIHFKKKKQLMIAIDRTQWRDKNIFVISLIWERRALPLYWQILSKRGSSNLQEQQLLIRPILKLLKNYQLVVLGDREFGSVKLASWLCEKNVTFVLRVKQGRYIQEEEEGFKRLSECGLVPGTSFYFREVKVTKQKGFGKFDIAGYWRRKYRDSGEDEGWYLLTNIGSFKKAVSAFKCRSGIEAMFKDCKTGGYNLEKSHACNDRLNSLILLIALAYSCAILQGRKLKLMGIQKYIGRVTEYRRSHRRHSSFWIGLYGQSWVVGMEFCQEIVTELMRIRRNKLPFFQRGLRAMSLILSGF